MFLALLDPDSSAITLVNCDNPALPYYQSGKETIHEGRKKDVLLKIEEWHEENFIPDELRIIQTVK